MREAYGLGHPDRMVIQAFLGRQGMRADDIDMEAGIRRFKEEMHHGLNGTGSSLAMIPTYLSPVESIAPNEPVIAIDAGGTNLRVALVRFDSQGNPKIDGYQGTAMPGTGSRVDRDTFFGQIVELLEPIAHRSCRIGFCFSYPTEILPSRDGRLIRFCKEVQADGIEGTLVGEGLLDAMRARGLWNGHRVALLNDTVATLLGGRAGTSGRRFDDGIGFILGTGTNTCYAERSALIEKLEGAPDCGERMLVNVESGAYAGFAQGGLDRLFDAGTVNPGQYVFEKMISGGYQGGLFLTILKAACREDLFPEPAAHALLSLDALVSADIDAFLARPFGDNPLARSCGAETDTGAATARRRIFHLADDLFERAARLVTVNLGAVVAMTGRGTNPCLPVLVSAEGSTFHKSMLFRPALDFHVRTLLRERMGLHLAFTRTDNATLLGTAIAGLSL